ncbi:hypothetical protein K503DRAFT_799985 [Rhizopogon vinicolor AM-OR11-026]|uniref:Uncharacterized protein n=1 Tax=Rhizopogon vinicolor AM-OR11-026 TaxID=1314800 RepID=A0A1B7N2E0_9AGAM|nr:hypothetical protein K503DRAFT_799985 [Rhizopogon vinicolor AM-OR11-026]
MSGAAAAHDVHNTDTEQRQGKHLKEDKGAYVQSHLARARIEGIEKWRAAVDAALQAAEEDSEQPNKNQPRNEEEMWGALEELRQKEKTETAGDTKVDVLEQKPTDMVEGTKQKRRSRRHGLWKGFRNLFFTF